MQRESPFRVVWWGTGIVTVIAPLVAGAVGSDRALIPVIFSGVGAIAVRIFWRWRSGPFREFIAAILEAPGSVAESVTGLVSSIVVCFIFGAVLVIIVVRAHHQPCLCLRNGWLVNLFNLALGSALFSGGMSLALVMAMFTLYRLFYSRSSTFHDGN